MLHTSILTATVFVSLTCVCAAQNFNIDVGVQFPVPQPSYGAAANQPGVWNQVSATPGSTALVDLTGASTGVSSRERRASAPTSITTTP